MAKTTDVEIVSRVNSCLDLERLRRILTDDEWNRFIHMLEDQRLIFSGDPTGFHLENETTDHVDDCGRAFGSPAR